MLRQPLSVRRPAPAAFRASSPDRGPRPSSPRRVLITLDAVGGVWRYAIDVARGLQAHGLRCLLVGFGPGPNSAQRAECNGLELVWTGEPLDWTVSDDAALASGAERLAALARAWDADLLHLNLPSQAAGLANDRPVVVVSHSCVPTWWHAVRGTDLPPDWAWHQRSNLAGFRRADAIAVPSASHEAELRRVYGELPPIRVIHNATAVERVDVPKEPIILSVGRWWDAGKNNETLDEAAAAVPWPVLLAGPIDGPGDQRATVRNARALGAMPHGEILALMRRSAIFAAPSRYEPFGLAVVEAAINGAALVLADIPTFRELWDGAAVFVPPNDAAAWARALTEMATDPSLRRRLSAESAVRARRFTLPRQAAELCHLYSSVGRAAVPA